MILIYLIVLASYLIFFRNVKGVITFGRAIESGLLGILLWLAIRALTLIVLISYIIYLFD